MASPHVAGGVALLLESRANLRRSHGGNDDQGDDESWRNSGDDNRNLARAADVRDILQNSAHPHNWFGNPNLGFLDNVQRQGAGMLDIVGAVQATSSLKPGKLSLGEGSGAITQRITIANNGKASVTYALSHAPALSNGPQIFTPSFLTGFADVAFSSPSVTVAPGESRSVSVTVTPNAALPDKSIYGGYVVVTPSAGTVLRVPYVGFKGDYQSIQILNEANLPAPFHGSPLILDGKGDPAAPNHAFTLKDDDQPAVAFHMDLQARRLTLEVIDATGETLGRSTDIEFVARNATSTGFFTIAWDGTFMPGQNGKKVKVAPNGQYTLRLSVEKPLAEKNNPAHVESWTSPSVTIARP